MLAQVRYFLPNLIYLFCFMVMLMSYIYEDPVEIYCCFQKDRRIIKFVTRKYR